MRVIRAVVRAIRVTPRRKGQPRGRESGSRHVLPHVRDDTAELPHAREDTAEFSHAREDTAEFSHVREDSRDLSPVKHS